MNPDSVREALAELVASRDDMERNASTKNYVRAIERHRDAWTRAREALATPAGTNGGANHA